VHVAIHFDEAGQEKERALDTLDHRQLWLRLGCHAMLTANGVNAIA
jgi:hypothetical protein